MSDRQQLGKTTFDEAETLIPAATKGDEESIARIIAAYMPYIRRLAGTMQAAGLEQDDFIQEGVIGLFGAIRRYKPETGNRFSTFAVTCIHNRMLSACEAAHRKKNSPLFMYHEIDDYKSQLRKSGGAAEQVVDPESIVIANEQVEHILRNLKTRLSHFEQQVLRLYLGGCSYDQMARQLGSTPKAVDNALQRVRKKLKTVLH